MSKIRKIFWVILGLGFLGILAYSFRAEPIPVEVGQASKGPMQVLVSQDGKTRVRDRYQILSPANGVLSRVELREGDSLESGQVCARISPLSPGLLDRRAEAEARARLDASRAALEGAESLAEQAEAALDYTRKELARVEIQADGGAVSDEMLSAAKFAFRRRTLELESARFKIAASRAEVAALTAYLDPPEDDAPEIIEVKCPVSGRVLRRHRESAGPIQVGAPILEVGDPRRIEVVVDFLSQDAVRVHAGDKAWIRRWGGTSEVLEATVQRVEPSGFTHVSALGVEEQRVNVIVDPGDEPASEWDRIGDGYRVDVDVIVWEEADVLRVPAGAVYRRDHQWYVFTVEDGIAREAPVEIGARSEEWAQIINGLEAGAPVIIYPPEDVEDGGKVESFAERDE